LTRGGFFPQSIAVPAPVPTPLQNTVRWLATHANFPAMRLPARAELLVLIVTAAEQEQVALHRAPRFLIESNDKAGNSSLKAYTMNRSLAHYVCNNAQKT
jgi:hypothetical protein